MKISIIGTGYVGLVTGACLAEKGHQVQCVDISADRVASLNRAESPIFEAGLEDLLRRHVGRTLSATTDLDAAVSSSDVTLIAVGTPFNGREIDLTAVLTATRQIGAALKRKTGYHVVVVKSTVVPGTTDERVLPELESASGKTAGRGLRRRDEPGVPLGGRSGRRLLSSRIASCSAASTSARSTSSHGSTNRSARTSRACA